MVFTSLSALFGARLPSVSQLCAERLAVEAPRSHTPSSPAPLVNPPRWLAHSPGSRTTLAYPLPQFTHPPGAPTTAALPRHPSLLRVSGVTSGLPWNDPSPTLRDSCGLESAKAEGGGRMVEGLCLQGRGGAVTG